MAGLTHERLLEIIDYDPKTGLMTWKKPHARARCVKAGDIVGTDNHGYRCVGLYNQKYLVHRLAWFYVYGKWPKKIDHKNGNRNDNRIENLREATRSQNIANKSAPQTNSSGFKGVFRKRKKWGARIKVRGNDHFLGVFHTPQEAHAAYCAAANQFFGEFARVA